MYILVGGLRSRRSPNAALRAACWRYCAERVLLRLRRKENRALRGMLAAASTTSLCVVQRCIAPYFSRSQLFQGSTISLQYITIHFFFYTFLKIKKDHCSLSNSFLRKFKTTKKSKLYRMLHCFAKPFTELYIKLEHGTELYGLVQNCTELWKIVQKSTNLYKTIRNSTKLYTTLQNHTQLHKSLQHLTKLFTTIQNSTKP